MISKRASELNNVYGRSSMHTFVTRLFLYVVYSISMGVCLTESDPNRLSMHLSSGGGAGAVPSPGEVLLHRLESGAGGGSRADGDAPAARPAAGRSQAQVQSQAGENGWGCGGPVIGRGGLLGEEYGLNCDRRTYIFIPGDFLGIKKKRLN